jgi:trk system potassium uptake protein TrkA
MYIVVIGLGEVGRHLVRELVQEGHDLVAIDADEAQIRFVEEHYDVMAIEGYGAREEVLAKAQVGRADLVVAVTDHDEVNLIAALAAQRAGAKRVVARAQGNEWARWTEGVRYGLLGVDVVINPRVLVAQELAKVARSHGAAEVIDLAQARIELVKMELDDETRHTGKPLSALDVPRDVLIAAIVRSGELFVPGGADVLLSGDRVYLIGVPSAVVALEDMMTRQRAARRVCIVGGGVIGEALARELLSGGAHVLLIERDRARAEELAVELERATVVCGDGTNVALLEEEDVASYDLFAAVTPEDEVNLMAALLAQRLSVPRTACAVHRGDYTDIYRQLGVDIVLSPRLVASDHILRYARAAEVRSLTRLEDGKAEVVELAVPDGSRAIGVPLKRLSLPRGALIAVIVRKDKVLVPRGDDTIERGDAVIVLTTAAARGSVERLFRSRGA